MTSFSKMHFIKKYDDYYFKTTKRITHTSVNNYLQINEKKNFVQGSVNVFGYVHIFAISIIFRFFLVLLETNSVHNCGPLYYLIIQPSHRWSHMKPFNVFIPPKFVCNICMLMSDGICYCMKPTEISDLISKQLGD